MKIEVDRDALLAGLRQVVDVVASKVTIPVLGNILLVAKAGELVMTGTDLDLQASAKVPAAGDLSTTVDKNKLLAAVQSLKPGKIVIEGETTQSVVMKQGRSRRTLQTLSSTDFPMRGAPEGTTSFRISASSLLRLFDAVSPAVGSNEVRRFYLSGVYMHALPDRLRTAASDGDRQAAYAEIALPEGAEAIPGTIIPEKAVNLLRKLLGKIDGQVTFGLSKAAITAEVGDTTIISRALDGDFPNYERVFPPVADHPIRLKRDALLEPIEAAAAVLNLEGDKLKYRRLIFDMKSGGEGHEVLGRDAGGASAVEPLDAEYDGPPMQFGLNREVARNLLNIFAESGSLTLSIANPEAPMRITSDKDPDVVVVIMPMGI